MGDDRVAACLADVLADFERQGGIDADDVNRLIDGHKLGGDESMQLLAELARLKLQFDEPSGETIGEITEERGCPEFRGTSVAARCASGCVHLIIVHDGSDRFGSLALERGAECG
jgi:hypothetical protein